MNLMSSSSPVEKRSASGCGDNPALDLYHAGYSIEKIAELLKVCKATVHNRVHKDGGYRCRAWTPAEDAILTGLYMGEYEPDLKQIAKQIGRTIAAIQCRANAIKIAVRKPDRPESRKKQAATMSLKWSFSEHPRGMLGKNHSEEARAKMSKTRTGKPGAKWSKKRRDERSKVMTERLQSENCYSRTKFGRRPDLNNRFFRSSWEANVARWLNYNGVKWEYEVKTFWFEKIRRGVRSYTPDFYLPDEDRFIEVKGWMDAKSKTKLKRMAKYYPEVKIELLDSKRYAGLASYKVLIPEWE